MRHLLAAPPPPNLCKGQKYHGLPAEGWIAVCITVGFVSGVLVGMLGTWIYYRTRKTQELTREAAAMAHIGGNSYANANRASNTKVFAPLSNSIIKFPTGDSHDGMSWQQPPKHPSAVSSLYTTNSNSLATSLGPSSNSNSLATSHGPSLDGPPLRRCESPERPIVLGRVRNNVGPPVRADVEAPVDTFGKGSLVRPAEPRRQPVGGPALQPADSGTTPAPSRLPAASASLAASDYNPFYDPKLVHTLGHDHTLPHTSAQLPAQHSAPSPPHQPAQPSTQSPVPSAAARPSVRPPAQSPPSRLPLSALTLPPSAAPRPAAPTSAARPEPIPLITPAPPITPEPASPPSPPSAKNFAFPVLEGAKESKEQESFGELLLLELDARLEVVGQPPLLQSERGQALRLLLQQRSGTPDVAAAIEYALEHICKNRAKRSA